MNKNYTAFLLSILMTFFLSITLARAQQKPVSSTLKIYRITTNNDGKQVRSPVSTTAPGDTLEYELTYTNNRSMAISNLKPVLPIPKEVQYIGGSAQPGIAMVSLSAKGRTFKNPPIQKKVKLANGSMEQHTVSAREYRRLQWNIPSLTAQDSVKMTARVWVIKKH